MRTKTTWKPAVMKGSFKHRLISLAFVPFLLAGCGEPVSPEPPVPEPGEDPVLHVSVPGAYGVKGGDKIVLPSSQTSVIYYDNMFNFKILEPSTLTVVSISGLPVVLKKGDRIPLHYVLSRGGRMLESEVYENVEILMTNDKMAWLKKNDEIFFVIQLL